MFMSKCKTVVKTRMKFNNKLSIILHPFLNCLVRFQIYNKFTDEVTVYMGPENGRRFFTVEKFNGKPNLGIWDDARCDSVKGATEGVTYHQFVSKNDTLKYLRKTMCRVTPLKYKSTYFQKKKPPFLFKTCI